MWPLAKTKKKVRRKQTRRLGFEGLEARRMMTAPTFADQDPYASAAHPHEMPLGVLVRVGGTVNGVINDPGGPGDNALSCVRVRWTHGGTTIATDFPLGLSFATNPGFARTVNGPRVFNDHFKPTSAGTWIAKVDIAVDMGGGAMVAAAGTTEDDYYFSIYNISPTVTVPSNTSVSPASAWNGQDIYVTGAVATLTGSTTPASITIDSGGTVTGGTQDAANVTLSGGTLASTSGADSVLRIIGDAQTSYINGDQSLVSDLAVAYAGVAAPILWVNTTASILRPTGRSATATHPLDSYSVIQATSSGPRTRDA